MDLEQWLSIGPTAGVTLGTAIGGLWFALRLIIAFQRDFTDRYAADNERMHKRLDEQDAEIDKLKDGLRECQAEKRAMANTLRQNNIPWNWEKDV